MSGNNDYLYLEIYNQSLKRFNSTMTKIYRYIFIIVFAFLIQVFSQPVNACVEGLKWGMDISNVETHLGVSLIPIQEKANQNLFEVKDI